MIGAPDSGASGPGSSTFNFRFLRKTPADSYITEYHVYGVLRLFQEITNHTSFAILRE